MTTYLNTLTHYNTWANTRMLGCIAAAGETRNLVVQKSSFATIRQTVLHILDAQVIWLSRLNGISPVEWPGKNFSGTAEQVCKLLIENSNEYRSFSGNLTTADTGRLITYHNLKGVQFQNTVSQVITHVMNHGTFHRGQLITLLRGAGSSELVATDMIAFYREFPG
jgi:uncharacterized damage-inducible protein DinB